MNGKGCRAGIQIEGASEQVDPKFLIAAIGTVGHLFPALAVAEALAPQRLLVVVGNGAEQVGEVFAGALMPGLALVGLYMAYLAVFGSVLSLSAYMYLLREVSASAVGTYAFVNPVIAVLLGWWLYQAASVYAPERWFDPFDPFSVMTCLAQWGIMLTIFVIFNKQIAGSLAPN